MICLRGGLGNQLFQYAFGRYVAYLHNTELTLNTWFYSSKEVITEREFELPYFNIFWSRLDYENWTNQKEITKAHPHLKFVSQPWFSREILQRILDLGDNLILSGEWSDYPEYLFDPKVDNLLRGDLTLKNPIADPRYGSLLTRIESSANSVAVHVRRGDYIDLPHLFTLVGEDYYERAFSLIESTIAQRTPRRVGEASAPEYFVFSDEIDAVEENFRFSRPVQFVRSGSTIGDFELMRRCRHIIAGNSTFSWWAAYLIENAEKIAIFPAQYFEDKTLQWAYEREYRPPTWLRV